MRGEKIHSKTNSIQSFRNRFAATHLGAVAVVDVSDASSNTTPMQVEAGLMELKLVPSFNEIFAARDKNQGWWWRRRTLIIKTVSKAGTINFFPIIQMDRKLYMWESNSLPQNRNLSLATTQVVTATECKRIETHFQLQELGKLWELTIIIFFIGSLLVISLENEIWMVSIGLGCHVSETCVPTPYG